MRWPASLLFAAFVVSGCLGTFVPSPTGDSPAGSNGTAVGGVSTGGGPTTGATADAGAEVANGGARDAAASSPGDLALHASTDLASSSVDMRSACIPKTSPLTSGHHNAGQACLGCHNGNRAINFSLGGTLYTSATGGSAIAGATIEVIDAKGTKVDIVTSQNGNFYSEQNLIAPFTVRASGCPNDVRMNATAAGDCSSSGCHSSTMQVHLP
jgi:hypothetical protein